jgi:hypothetical protein
MKYEKFIKIAIGVVAVAVFFVVPTVTSAAVTKPAITSIAGDGYINAAEAPSFYVIGTMTATSSFSTTTVNLSDGLNSATTTTRLPGEVVYYSATSSATTLTDRTINVSVWVFDGVATSTVATTTAILDTALPTATVAWTDEDGNTNINTGDKVVVTFSEVMSTTTVSTTTLAISAHTFGNSTSVWSGTSDSTIFTITLGSTATVASGDTINPTSAVTDVAGNPDGTLTAQAITDSTAPLTPVASLAAGTYTSTQITTLTSTGSSNIYFTVDGSTPACSSTLYDGNFVIINHSLTLKAVGCDAYSNVTVTPLSVDYVISGTGSTGGGSGGGGGWSNPNAATPATPAMPGVNPAVPATPSLRALTVRLSKDLSVGSEGDDVAALQTFLVRSGYLVMPNGVAKGFFGGLTKKAVMWFQKDKGLPTPGRVGPMTRNILNQDQ